MPRGTVLMPRWRWAAFSTIFACALWQLPCGEWWGPFADDDARRSPDLLGRLTCRPCVPDSVPRSAPAGIPYVNPLWAPSRHGTSHPRKMSPAVGATGERNFYVLRESLLGRFFLGGGTRWVAHFIKGAASRWSLWPGGDAPNLDSASVQSTRRGTRGGERRRTQAHSW
jgi:hypothetical protein